MFKADCKVVMLLAALIVAGSAQFAAGQDFNGVLTGTVKTASGQAASGAFVKALNAERRLTFLAVTQDQGRYRLSNLPPGKYTVLGIGGGSQSDSPAAVDVASGKEASVNLTLNAPQPVRELGPRHPSGPALNDKERAVEKVYQDWRENKIRSMLPEGPGLAILKANCTACHGLSNPTNHRGSPEDWAAVVSLMLNRRAAEKLPMPSKEEEATLVDYLSKNFGVDVPKMPEALLTSHFPRTFVKGSGAKYTATEYRLPAGAGAHDATADQDGIAWVNDESGNSIGRFDPKTLTYYRVVIPKGKNGRRADTKGIEVDPKGHVWTMDAPNERVLEYDPKTQKFNQFEGPIGGGESWNTIQILADGTIWGSDVRQNKIVKLDPATGKFTFYAVPSGIQKKGGNRPYGMATDGAGMLWFAEQGSNRAGELDPKTGEITEFPMPEINEGDRPRRMGADSKGDIWMSITEVNKIVHWDYRNHKYTMFTPPTADSGPYGVNVDKKHNLVYFSESKGDKVGRFDPKTNTFAEFGLPTPGGGIKRVQVDPSRPNRIWYSGAGESYDQIGYVDIIE